MSTILVLKFTLLLVAITTRLSMIVSDITVVAVTWRQTFHHYREASQLAMRTDLSTTLLRDGMYLLVGM